ncbi:MAG: hypothetical protein Q7R55_00220 [Candidatus Wildermuthbacteria bacterium]|nr:hypothetical protein [Candidatus Wildermuthbacteria bacterium]
MFLKFQKTLLVSTGIVIGISFFGFIHSAKAASCSTEGNPGADILRGVVLYKDNNCEGDYVQLHARTTKQWATIPPPVGNDETSSLILKGDISVFLYENVNGGGISICWNSPQEQLIPGLKSKGFDWNDKLSSIKVDEPGKCTNPGEQLPIGAACAPLGGQKSTYQCSGSTDNAGILLTGQDGNLGNCSYQCRDADGSMLRYGAGTKEDPYAWYCFGATDQTKTCKLSEGQTTEDVNVVTGIKKEAEDCGVLGIGCLLTTLINAVSGLVDIFIFGLAAITKAVATTLALTMNKVIQYVLTVPISPDAEGAPPFLKVIWDYSRALANSFFVLMLAIIGFTTILRIQSYQWQKTLPSLLIAVLLINFSGVLVGFVVDMANIVTNAFLGDAVKSTNWGAQDIPLPGTGGSTEKLAYHVGEIIFYLFVSFAYFATMLLFVVRTVVLWILAAIAPLAFALYVLPATKTYWQQWFKALFQWAIMGIPASFAIFFASKALSLTGQSIGTGTPPAFFAQVAGPFTAAIILIVGMGMALAGAPAISQKTFALGSKWGKKWGAAAGEYASTQTLGRALATKKGTDAAKNLTKTDLGVLSRKELGARWKDAGFLGKAGLAARFAANPSLMSMRWGIRQAGKQALQYGAKQPQAIDRRVGEFEKQFGKDYDRAAATYATMGSLDYEGKTALALYLAKVKGGKGISKLNEDQQREVVKLAARYAPSKLEDIIKHVPGLIDDLEVGELIQKTMISDGVAQDIQGKYKDADVQKTFEETGITDAKALLKEATYKKAVEAMKAVDFENADKSIMDNKKFREHVARWQPWNIIRKIGEEWGAEMIGKLQDEAETIGLTSVAKTNASFINSAYTPQGRVFMREWVGPNTHAPMGQAAAKTFVANARRSPYANTPPPAVKTPEETAMIDRLANTVFSSTPPGSPKTLAEVRTEVEREYDGQYRVRTHEQLLKNPDLVGWRANREFGGDQNQAREAYREEIFALLRWKEQNPPPRNISSKEEKTMDSIARGGAMPKPSDAQRSRKLLGASYKTSTLLTEAENNIGRLSKHITDVESKGGDASLLRADRADWERSYDAHKTKLYDVMRELNI